MELIAKLKEMIVTIEAESVKFYEKGNKSAGTRVRKELQELKKLAQEIRLDVQNKKTAE